MEWYEQSGAYRISWCATGVATAWAPGRWHCWDYMPIGYYREGSLEQNKQAARDACRAHYKMTTEAKRGTG